MGDHYPDEFTHRFLQQARLLSKTSDAERADGYLFVKNARLLGQLLHVVRELVDSACLPNSTNLATIRLWEQGLVLPHEIEDGEVMTTVLWYIAGLRVQ